MTNNNDSKTFPTAQCFQTGLHGEHDWGQYASDDKYTKHCPGIAPARPPRPHIDSLDEGQRVVLNFTGEHRHETVTFIRHTTGATAEDRRAVFESIDSDGKPYQWEAYRHANHWAYGTSADRLSVVGLVVETNPERYWWSSMSDEDVAVVFDGNPAPFEETYQVNDDEEGGTIAYTGSEQQAIRIVAALQAANKN
jgi:hypothetical protein